MSKRRRLGLVLVLITGGLSVLWGCFLGWTLTKGPMDFQAVYYGSLTLLEHHDPYNISDVEAVYRAEGGDRQRVNARQHEDMTLYVNTPATLALIAPFAMIPMAVGQVLWLILSAGSMMLAAFLMWDIGADYAPVLSGCLVGFLLANCQVIFAGGNTAGLVVGLTVVAAWCFLRNRFVLAGVVCMAVSLAIKPHDTGLVWLFFLLAGGIYRKRALQTAALTAALIIPAVLWTSVAVPQWVHDWNTNLAIIAAPGGINDPRPAATVKITADNVISLQAVFSVFRDSPRFYNWASYLVCGVLILIFAVTVMRTRFTLERAWFALAAVVPLTVLVTYHRLHDTKLLLLAVPACAILWAGGGAIGRTAAILTSAGVVLNSDIPITIFGTIIDQLHISTATWVGKILTVMLARPNQEILLALGIFYLWIYVRRSCDARSSGEDDGSKAEISNPAVLSEAGV